MNESDNFWMPLNFPCLSAVLKQHLSEREVRIKAVDCCARKIGWTSLARILEEEQADILGFGDETCYSEEGLRLARLAKAVKPDCLVVAGGSHFPYVAEETLGNSGIDITVIGEGEFTFLELVQHVLSGNPDFSKIQGIAYVDDGHVRLNDPRPVIADLDQLPLPDYDLMDFDCYGHGGAFFALSGVVQMFHSRGCFSGCTYCAFWPTESQWKRNEQGDLVPIPTYRSKSVEKTIAEMDVLYHKYNRRFFTWIDGTFNAVSEWNDRWAEAILRRGWDLRWFAFQRADCLARDEELGILEKMVRTGLIYTIVGVERHRNADFQKFHKINYDTQMVARICRTIQRKYPQIFLQGTFIIGLEDDNKEELFRLIDYAADIGIDFPSFHFISPAPGTLLYQELKRQGKTAGLDYSKMDWFTPLWPTRYLSEDQLSSLLYAMMKRYMLKKPGYAKNLISPHRYKRSLYWWFLWIAIKFFLAELRHGLTGQERMLTLQEPGWYDN